MKSKDRITAYVCTDAIGDKVPMAFIGKSKTPRCFRIEKPPVLTTSGKRTRGLILLPFDDGFTIFLFNMYDDLRQ